MNLYRQLGHASGTSEALELAERLSAWHDAMVAHERRLESVCDDECPHAEAPALWREALRVFGPGAHELRFLARRATDVAAASHAMEAGR